MARVSPSPRLAAPQPQSVGWLLALHLVGILVGIGMAVLVFRQLHGLGGGQPLVHQVLALDESIGPHASSGALGSGSAMLAISTLAIATAAAVALIIGAVLGCWPVSRRTAHRLSTIGLWMALGVCLAAMLPGLGYSFGSSPDMGPGGYDWQPAPKALAIMSAAGLLLSSITAVRSKPVTVGSST